MSAPYTELDEIQLAGYTCRAFFCGMTDDELRRHGAKAMQEMHWDHRPHVRNTAWRWFCNIQAELIIRARAEGSNYTAYGNGETAWYERVADDQLACSRAIAEFKETAGEGWGVA